MKLSRLCFAGLALALMAGIARADAATEFWPELDTWIKLSDSFRLLLTTDGTRDRDSGDRINSEGALYIDYRYSGRISFRAGYVYSVSPPITIGVSNIVERRWVIDTSYNWQLSEAMRFTNRVRVDLRDVESASSTRVRDRLKLEYETHIGHQSVVPYGNLEAYYDSRFAQVSRYRLELGATTRLSKDIEIDLYAGRQRDTQPRTKYTNGIGVTVSLYL